jgi:hypothetical protein
MVNISGPFATDMETRIPEKLAALKQPVYYYQSTGDIKKKKLPEVH